MNDLQRDRLMNHLDPDHECDPYHGGCQMPHHRYNATLPRWLTNWPDSSPARARVETARIARAWRN